MPLQEKKKEYTNLLIRFLTHLDFVQLKTEDIIIIVPHLYFCAMPRNVHKASTYFPHSNNTL